MAHDKVFVIIVTYNGMRWIKKCLDSIKGSGVEIEVVVIDNASKDETVKFIRSNYEAVHLIENNENLGFGKANNLGLTYALTRGCDYVFLLNQDTILDSGTIKNLVDVSKSHSEYGVISPIHMDVTGDHLDNSFFYYIKNSDCNSFIEDRILEKKLREIYDLKMINAAAWLLPVNTLNTVGGFSPLFFLYGEDDNYCQRVLFHNLKIGFTPKGRIYHDSENNNTGVFEPGSPKYFRKFINRVKIRYANINTEEYKNLPKLRNYYFKKALFSILALDVEKFNLYYKKCKLIAQLNIERNIKIERKAHRSYL
jgi:GT2 family glycosyltransferase